MRLVGDIERVRRVVGGVAVEEVVLAESVLAAAVLRDVRATRPGFAFELYVCVRETRLDVRRAARGLYEWEDELPTAAAEAMTCTVRFSDGRVFRGGASSQSRELRMLAGSGTEAGWISWFWVPDVPTQGEVLIEFSWPRAKIEGSASLTGAELDAAEKKSRILLE